MTSPCVCGGIIMATPLVPLSEAVRLHQQSLTHVVWRAGREEPTADHDARDMSSRPASASAPPAPSLGPCECQGCGAYLFWYAEGVWREPDGVLHRCRAAVQ